MQGQKSKGEKIMEDNKVLKDEELKKVNGGWTHDTATIYSATNSASCKFGELQYRVVRSDQFSSGVKETVEILYKLSDICKRAGNQTLDIESAIHQLQDLIWSIPISEIKSACDDIWFELTEAVI